MHFFPDTNDVDAAAEVFWAETFKQVLKDDLRRVIGTQLHGDMLQHIYERRFSDDFPDFENFNNQISDMIAIGAENGADNTFDDIYTSFLTESPLPQMRRYAANYLPDIFPEGIQRQIYDAVIDEYSQEKVFRYAYKVGYQKDFADFENFIQTVAGLIVSGSVMGADDMVGRVFLAFMTQGPLPPARRYPKRLKSW
jgi:hypothetical protein